MERATGPSCRATRPTSEPPPQSPRRRKWTWRRRLVVIACSGAALLVLLYVFRAPLLTGLAHAWIVDEPVTRADAIVVLGGGLENRPFAAAKLFHEGVAPKILYMNVKLEPSQEMGITPPEAALTRKVLMGCGVPEEALEVIGNGVASTFDESVAVRGWAEKNGASSIVIPTDLFHTRRVNWLFEKQLQKDPQTETRINVLAVDPIRYAATNWWQHEEGIIAFQNEIIKSIYYRFKY